MSELCLYKIFKCDSQSEFDDFIDGLPNSIVRRITIFEKNYNQLSQKFDGISDAELRDFEFPTVEELFGYDSVDDYERFITKIHNEYPDVSEGIDYLDFAAKFFLSSKGLNQKFAIVEENNKIHIENCVLLKSEIVSVGVRTIQIPVGDDFNVFQRDMVVLEVDKKDNSCVIIYDKNMFGDLVNGMIANAKLAKKKYQNLQPIRGGLSIFRTYYDELYCKNKWIGVNMPMEEVIPLFPADLF